jgi:hypothetical protein
VLRTCPFLLLALAISACGSSPNEPSASTSSGSATSTSDASSSSTGGRGGGGAGGGGVGGAGGGGTGGAPFQTAMHEPFPLANPHGGTVLKAVELVTITWQGHEFAQQIQTFGDFVVSSNWYTTAGEEYGVGPGTHLAKLVLPDPVPATLTDAGIVTLIDQHILDKTLPPPDENTLYLVYPPPDTVTDGGDGLGILCQDYTGYHYDVMGMSGHIVYGVVGDCMIGLDDVTGTAAHEIFESATDPADDGYYIDGPANLPWNYIDDGTELGDLCEYFDYIHQGGYALQRMWSNKAAAAGQNPCPPAPDGEVYINVSAAPAPMQQVAPGWTATFTLTGWSLGPTDPWPVEALSETLLDFAPKIDFKTTMMGNGDTATITLTVPMVAIAGQMGVVRVYSGPKGASYWPIGVIAK